MATSIDSSLGFRSVRRNYNNLSLSVLDHALRDATGTREIAPEERREAKEFLFSTEAEFWAEAAGVNIWTIRQVLKERLGAQAE